jgi:RNA ligase
MERLHKYPRTHHLEGSRLQPGDQDLESVPFGEIAGRHLVVEEKIDGANSGLSFDAGGKLLLQSRGHFLRGGATERQFDILKSWAHAHAPALREVLGQRYVVYGEWLFAKHTVFYDALPHYFLEFDVLDRETGAFLSTDRRRALLAPLPLVSVPVLASGRFERLHELTSLVGRSRLKTERWRESLDEAAREQGLDLARVRRETDLADAMEGLYLKLEEEGRVVARLKFIRASFLQTVLDSASHWMDRPLVVNRLAPGVDIFRGKDESP